MITQDNLNTALEFLGFTKTGQKHSKSIAATLARKQAILERYLRKRQKKCFGIIPLPISTERCHD